MIDDIKHLQLEEQQTLLKTPAYVAILIAGADNNIDRREKSLAISLAKLKTYRARQVLLGYFNEVYKNFEVEFEELIQELPKTSDERYPILEAELSKLNTILPKLDKKFSIQFYASMKDFAKQIAEASGGVLGYMSVGPEEQKLLSLKMINNPE